MEYKLNEKLNTGALIKNMDGLYFRYYNIRELLANATHQITSTI